MPRVEHSWHPEVAVGTRNGKRERDRDSKHFLHSSEESLKILNWRGKMIEKEKKWQPGYLVTRLVLADLAEEERRVKKRAMERYEVRVWLHSVPLYESLLAPPWRGPRARSREERTTKVEDGRRISWECNAEISAWTSSSSLPLPFLPPLCPHLVPAALTQPDQIAITNITYDDRLDDFSSPPSNRFLARRSVSENWSRKMTNVRSLPSEIERGNLRLSI